MSYFSLVSEGKENELRMLGGINTDVNYVTVGVFFSCQYRKW